MYHYLIMQVSSAEADCVVAELSTWDIDESDISWAKLV